MTRREKLLCGLDLRRIRGIEVGPLASPIVGKHESEVYYVDHLDEDALRKKYRHEPNVNLQGIAKVDAVWGDRTLRDCFPDAGQFDYVIASHVIEHVPDMLGWIWEVAEVLRPRARLALAVPDKRFTFDYLRQPSRLCEVADAYLRQLRRPSPAQIFDYNANAVAVNAVEAWQDRIDPALLKHFVSLRCALDRSIEGFRDHKYIDGHCWVFTARSFAALAVDLIELDLLPFTCLHFYPPDRNSDEFVVVMERWADTCDTEKERARKSFLTQVERLDEADESKLRAAADESGALQSKVHALESQVSALVGSRSFRITRPFRQVVAALRRLRFDK